MKLRAVLLCTALCLPMRVEADPVSGFFIGLAGTTGVAATAAAVAAPTAFAVGAFLGGTVVGNLLLNVGLSLAITAINKPKSPTIEDARINSKQSNATRWVMGGEVLRGGDAGTFMEYDEDGNFWFFMVHGDAEIVNDPVYILDGIKVELSDGTDGFTAGDVITDAFCLDGDDNQYEGSGSRKPVWRIYTITPDASNAYGERPDAFSDAFPDLPDDFYGVGICYSIIRCRTIKAAKRSNAYRWRGPIGIGEPSVSLFVNFNRMYDPRNPAHDIDDATTWTASDGNPNIIWAWWRTSPRGRNQPMSDIEWEKVAAWADIFDNTVLNRLGDPVPLYRCGVAFPDTKPRQECEADILATCDGFVAYSDEGKAYVVGGYYEEPTLAINAARDVYTAETQTVDDGEKALDGVVVEYISPDHGYTKQPSAPWVNTLHYDGVSEPNYLKIPILGCTDHNQAVRLAKANGLRLQPRDQAAYGTTIKSILAAGQRGVTLNHDEVFTGPHEIVTPVEQDTSGKLCRYAVVPLQADRWYLNDGEEGAPPQLTPILDIDNTLAVAENVIVIAETVATSSGSAVRLAAAFDAPSRIDRFYRFRAALSGVTTYLTTDMDALTSTSGILSDGETYRVSWQTVTAGGRATVWSDERDTPLFYDIVAVANATPPAGLTGFSGVGGEEVAGLSIVTADDSNQSTVAVFRGATDVFSAAEQVEILIVAGGAQRNFQEALSGGVYYYWAVPANGSGVPGATSGSISVTVTDAPPPESNGGGD